MYCPSPSNYNFHLDPPTRLATTDMGQKLDDCVTIFGGRGWRAESPSNTRWPDRGLLLDPSNHLATIHQRHRQRGQTDRAENVPIG